MTARPAARARPRPPAGAAAYAAAYGLPAPRRDTALRTVRRRDRLLVPVLLPVLRRDRAGRPAALRLYRPGRLR